jgi:hypothetical protein
MKEERLIERFIDGLRTYPFKTHIEREVHVSKGRADIRLPDYDVVIEAKGEDGSVKSAIGQAIWYGTALNDRPYILIPASDITNMVEHICQESNIGILTATQLPRLVYDIGGFEPFDLYDYNGPTRADEKSTKEGNELVIGGIEFEESNKHGEENIIW